MVAQKGRNVSLKYYNGSTYVLAGGARDLKLTINNELVDVTNADSAGIRTLLEGGGVNSIGITLEGVYVDDAAINALRTYAATNTHCNFQFLMPGSPGKTYQGSFAIPTFEEGGNYKDAAMVSLKFESAGAVTIS